MDRAGALAAGYTPEEITAEEVRRIRAAQSAEDAKIRAQGGLSGDEGFLGNLNIGAGKALSDIGLGAQQLAAQAGFGDKAALAAEAADREKRDKALMGTAGGVLGKFGTDAAVSMLPMGAATRAAGLLPKVMGLRAIAPQMATGAAQGVLSPDANYSVGNQAGWGAGAGLAGDLVGRGVGRALKPMQGAIPEAVRARVEQLSGMPALLAENITGNKTVRAFTNALAQIPGFGAGVKGAREANLGKYTSEVTGAAGMPTRALTDEGASAMDAKLAKEWLQTRSGPDVPIPQLAPELQAALDMNRRAMDFSNKRGGARTLKAAIEAASVPPGVIPGAATRPGIYDTLDKNIVEQPGLGISRTLEEAATASPHGYPGNPVPNPPPHVPPGPPATPSLTADEAVTLRSMASDAAHGMADNPSAVLDRRAQIALAKELESAIGATHRDKGASFARLRAEEGVRKDIEKAGTTDTGHILPEDFLKTMTPSQRLNPQTPREKRTVAAANLMPSPGLSENRSLMVRLLMGALPLSGATAGFGLGSMSDSGMLGAGAGAAGSLGLAHLLLGTPGGGRYLAGQARSGMGRALQSDAAKEYARLLGITGANELVQ